MILCNDKWIISLRIYNKHTYRKRKIKIHEINTDRSEVRNKLQYSQYYMLSN